MSRGLRIDIYTETIPNLSVANVGHPSPGAATLENAEIAPPDARVLWEEAIEPYYHLARKPILSADLADPLCADAGVVDSHLQAAKAVTAQAFMAIEMARTGMMTPESLQATLHARSREFVRHLQAMREHDISPEVLDDLNPAPHWFRGRSDLT